MTQCAKESLVNLVTAVDAVEQDIETQASSALTTKRPSESRNGTVRFVVDGKFDIEPVAVPRRIDFRATLEAAVIVRVEIVHDPAGRTDRDRLLVLK
jgi:hypothetical protein